MRIWPRRNLNPESEEWGREVEVRTAELESVAASLGADVSGQNRTSAATAGDLARKLQRLDDLLRAIPQTRQTSAEFSGYGLSGGWQTVAQATVTAPANANFAEVLALGSGRMESTGASLMSGQARLTTPLGATPAFPFAWYPGLGNFVAVFNPTFSWHQNIVAGTAITVGLQVNPDDAISWGANPINYASVTLLATFTGR